jgi:hypothetical protein
MLFRIYFYDITWLLGSFSAVKQLMSILCILARSRVLSTRQSALYWLQCYPSPVVQVIQICSSIDDQPKTNPVENNGVWEFQINL